METLKDRVAVVTGGASGIGLGMARALGAAGARLVIADIEAPALAAAEAELRGQGVDVLAVEVDVADTASVERLAERTVARFGAAHVLCNNAGVGLEGPVESWSDAGWRWVLDVNLMGVVRGVRAFAPILERSGGGHIVNTASIGGLIGGANHGQYVATKFAVVGLSQSLREELAPAGIGVSVLCPGFVRSRIADSARNAPGDLPQRQAWLMRDGFEGPAADFFRMLETRIAAGLDPDVVGELVRDAILTGDFYIFTETEFADEAERRMRWVKRALDKTRAWAAARETEAAHG